MAATEESEVRATQKIIFNNATLLHFIELYRKNECLWNVKAVDYKKSDKRKKAVAEMAIQFGVTEEFVKKKIQSLRSTYIQEKKKIADSKRTGTGSDDVYIPSLFWFHELEFLQDVIIPRKTTSNLDNNTQVSRLKLYWILFIKFMNIVYLKYIIYFAIDKSVRLCCKNNWLTLRVFHVQNLMKSCYLRVVDPQKCQYWDLH